MHTMMKQDDAQWCVGLIIFDGERDRFERMFHGLSLLSAINLVNALNGGGGIEGLKSDGFKALEYCAI
jgi:hypothetical protein